MYIDDDIHFSFKDIAPIRDDDEYGGYRASIEGVLETIITPMQSLYLFANKEHLKMALQATAIHLPLSQTKMKLSILFPAFAPIICNITNYGI